ncbi:T9SS type B sorting domain-containing protein [Sabulilitoribacter arenilitoris]|uniref:T9SS type B sorting domain-containing protein n=1 Tax=Wocania arenilitoris TaxID=2044858 RepID=A0AAE3EMG8_9FLAO|nr:T9SS type B sorting domain-containing protein [Wocania arenilitoris]MCF7567716.1 T9SS type B sorting domain-containing protein [Wocania arenilitoris]
MKNILSLLFVLSVISVSAQITLTHNVGNIPIDTGMPNCEDEEHWARAFTLSDFGITTSEQFIIRSGQVAISNSYNGAIMAFDIFGIDSNFPNSTPNYIGGAVTYAPQIGNVPEIVPIEFLNPIVVPTDVEKILVVVTQSDDIYNPDYKEVLIAGTAQDNDVSWFSGCREYYTYTPTTELNNPVPNANFFINVTGETFSPSNYGSNTTLTHNVCDNVIRTSQHSCSFGEQSWARVFNLEDFGISDNEEFIINSGQIGVSSTRGGATVTFNIYEIDDNFPSSFSENSLIGSSQEVQIPYVDSYYNITRIFTIDFNFPIAVSASIKRILVVVNVGIVWGDGVMFIGGTEQDNDVSWYKGCSTANGGFLPSFVTTESIGYGDARFFINVTGNVNHITNNFEMNISNICSEFLKEFSVENKDNIASVIWDFGDSASGADNTSADLSPFHDFSSDGTYTVTATVTGNDSSVEVLTETINVKEPPNVYGINNIEACEDSPNSGFTSSFNTSTIQSQVLGSQTGRVVTYIDGSGNEYETLPNPFTNTIKDRETITVRVARSDELCCYSETSFDLIVNPLPDLTTIEDIQECDDDTDGFTTFNLTQIQSDLSGNNNLVNFYFEDGGQISNSQLNAVINKIENEETITVRVTNNVTHCYNETNFKLIVNPLPIANALDELIGCDDNNDGISEYFDTTNVENIVLGNQNGMVVTYYNSAGNPINLTNPFTNSTPNHETITVRVTNKQTNCYAETQLVLNTSTKPQINTPIDKYSCNEGNGVGSFNLGSLKNEIIGNQNNLNVYYFDVNGTDITNTITSNFKNTIAWNQTIFVKVENASSNLCMSETSFNLIVNELPEVNIESEYFLCNLEPSLEVAVGSGFNSYEWIFEDGTLISNNYNATLTYAGNYSLKISEIKNGITCENNYGFKLVRSVLPKIENVEFQELSDSNFIKINASGDGDFQYSIDGNIYQNSNTFNNVLGGIYTVYVRDRLGCGIDSKEITIIDYPKYFTPNNDGNNDFWHIRGVSNYPNAIVNIYDRYGKLLKQINSNSSGWDGTFSGKYMPNSDYWFTVFLNEEKSFTGHFALKR